MLKIFQKSRAPFIFFIMLIFPATHVVAGGKMYTPLLIESLQSHDEQIVQFNAEIDQQLKRLKRELDENLKVLKASEGCKSLDCEQLKASYDSLNQLMVEAYFMGKLARASARHREYVADFQDQVVSQIKKGKKSIADTLWWQELATGSAKLSIAILDAILTGNAADLTGQVKTVGIGIFNVGANMAVDNVTGYQSKVGAIGKGSTKAIGLGESSQAFAKTMTKELSKFGALTLSKKGKTVFSPKIKLKKIPNSKSLAGIISKTVIDAATASSMGKTRADLQMADKELQKALQYRIDMHLAALVMKRRIDEIRRQKNETAGFRDRLFDMFSECAFKNRESKCRTQMDTVLEQAEQARDTRVKQAEVRRNEAKERLASIRKQRNNKFHEVENTHEQLRMAKDRLADAQYLEQNRSKIKILAAQAKDAQIREKYKKELSRLQQAGTVEAAAKQVDALEQRRKSLWDEISDLQQKIGTASENSSNVYRETEQVITAAENAYVQAISKAREDYHKCAGSRQWMSAKPEHVAKPGKALTKTLQEGGQIPPDEIYRQFEAAQSAVLAELNKARVHLLKTGKQCPEKKAAVSQPFAESGCWAGIGSRLMLYPNLDAGMVRGQMDWFVTEGPVTMRGSYRNGHLLLHGSSEEFTEFAMVSSLELELDVIKDKGGTTFSSPYQVTKLKGVSIRKNAEQKNKQAIEFYPIFVEPSSIRFVQQDFKTPMKEIRSGQSLWIEAKGQNICSGVVDKMVLNLSIPDASKPFNQVVVLTETGTDTGQFRSQAAGITIAAYPGPAKAHIVAQAEPESATAGLILWGKNPNADVNVAPPASASVSFLRKSPVSEIPAGKNPLLPDVSYQAVQISEIGKHKSRLMIHYAPGRMRQEFPGNTMASITRYDKFVLWTLWTKDKKYQEINASTMLQSTMGVVEVSREKLGRENVHGVAATKYRIVTEDSNAKRKEGIFWISDQGVVVKLDTVMDQGGKKVPYRMELSELKVRPQAAALFEIPEGFSVRLPGR